MTPTGSPRCHVNLKGSERREGKDEVCGSPMGKHVQWHVAPMIHGDSLLASGGIKGRRLRCHMNWAQSRLASKSFELGDKLGNTRSPRRLQKALDVRVNDGSSAASWSSLSRARDVRGGCRFLGPVKPTFRYCLASCLHKRPSAASNFITVQVAPVARCFPSAAAVLRGFIYEKSRWSHSH